MTNLKNNINQESNSNTFDQIEDTPITQENFEKVLFKYMKSRNLDKIEKIFDKSFDISIFNQVYVDLKKQSSKEIVLKEPSALSANSLMKYTILSF